ncbi:hypothetical protein SSABA_v1c05090 [Spiroplasma sabaudiense Ar-1343]|uniref:Uncharacterized protein n=1 Tax=Spiroplasma sabaudiense Ar-1343 TaxID=1276257 RepID=W6AA78_9MOLU|nr:hypothetical protein [Spiroplasma sabaudiense]AHI53916.1 hypothetical protein SSABA_v1c05090 [Spiroplasma sabaudiense Ar-1343]
MGNEEKQINLKTFLDKVGLVWFRKNLARKIEVFRLDFLEASNEKSDNPFTPPTVLPITTQSIDNVTGEFKDLLAEMDSIDEVQDFANKSNNIFELTNMFANQGSNKYAENLMQELMDNQIEIESLVVKVQIETIFKILLKSLEMTNEIAKKIGEETSIRLVDIDDLKYLINLSIKKSLDSFDVWISKNYQELEHFKEELKSLKENEFDYEKNLQNAEIIVLYFKQFKIKEVTQDFEKSASENELKINQSSADKFINFTEGAQLASDIKNKLDLAIEILKEYNKLKNIKK